MSLEVDDKIPLYSVARAQKQWIDARFLQARRGWAEEACLIVFELMITLVPSRGTSYSTISCDLLRVRS